MLANPFLYWMNFFYGWFVALGSNLQSIFLLYMRLTWGHQFFLNGAFKHEGMLGGFELIGGICLILGLASRLVSIPLIITTITLLTTEHAESLAGFQFILAPHVLVQQEPYPYLITALLVFIFGPGRVSLDAWIKRWVSHQPKY